jgi:hypothetical protein
MIAASIDSPGDGGEGGGPAGWEAREELTDGEATYEKGGGQDDRISTVA